MVLYIGNLLSGLEEVNGGEKTHTQLPERFELFKFIFSQGQGTSLLLPV
jgi:hypothetical protein